MLICNVSLADYIEQEQGFFYFMTGTAWFMILMSSDQVYLGITSIGRPYACLHFKTIKILFCVIDTDHPVPYPVWYSVWIYNYIFEYIYWYYDKTHQCDRFQHFQILHHLGSKSHHWNEGQRLKLTIVKSIINSLHKTCLSAFLSLSNANS